MKRVLKPIPGARRTAALPAVVIALGTAACGTGPRHPESNSGKNWSFESEPTARQLCPSVAPGRGCRVNPFQATCSTYFVANTRELTDVRGSGYMSLRFGGEHGPKSDKPPFIPWAAYEGSVISGLHTNDLALLAATMGIGRAEDSLFPSDEVMTYQASGHVYSATLFRLSARLVGALASSSDEQRRKLAEGWDALTRTSSEVSFNAAGLDDCSQLVERIAEHAAHAVATHRDVYLLTSLSKPALACGERPNCDGYHCQIRDDGSPYCMSERDQCILGRDCAARQRCEYSAVAERYECR
jgi:hypothetical protein